MRADDGRIDHLQSRVAHSTSSERLQDHIPDAAVGPPSKLPKDRIPVAELLRQVAPRRASSHQPKDRVEHTTMVARRPTAAAYQERLEIRPLIVRHQSANHRRSPQRAALNQFAILASIDLSTRPSRGSDSFQTCPVITFPGHAPSGTFLVLPRRPRVHLRARHPAGPRCPPPTPWDRFAQRLP